MKRIIVILLLALGIGYAQAQDDGLQTVIVAGNQEAELAYNKGIENFKKKKLDEAVRFFTEAISYKVDFAKAYFNRASAKSELGDLAGAMADYDKVIELEPSNGNAHFSRAMLLLTDRKYDEAFADLLLAQTKGMKDAKIPYYMGVVKFQLVDYTLASEYFSDAIAQKADYAYAFNDRASAYRMLKEYDKAIADYQMAIEIMSDKAIFYNNLGSAYRKKEDYKAAILAYTKAIELDTNYFLAYNNRGSAKFESEDYEGALSDFDKAIELKADYAYAYNNKGTVLFKMENYQESVVVLDKAIELNPNYGYAYVNRGNSKEYLLDFKGACLDWQKAIDLGVKEAEKFMKSCN